MDKEAEPADSPSLFELYAAVQGESPENRDDKLQRLCRGDQRKRQMLEAMLVLPDSGRTNPLDRLEGALKSTAVEAVKHSALPEHDSKVVGPYKLLESIGEGGMGLVYLAQQTKPVRRKVALKIIKPGMDSRQVIARFEAERQALAMMDHPHIAKVLDAGTTDDGRPFFVMELVRGIPITEYCDRAKMTIRRRLELFCEACGAVQHAHNKGIIHRDIKPSNVLVAENDGAPLVKVIDFGVAKALTNDLTEKTMYTGVFQMIGTPLYMSPEQASMSSIDVDTRSDVYSLGVLLYELITGALPVDRESIRDLSYEQLRHCIETSEPIRPSKRLSTLREERDTLAKCRSLEPHKLQGIFVDELDWIAMKALEKERKLRYQSPRDLADDIQRYLSDEVVQARAPSFQYKLRKTLKRHRSLAMTASAIALCLIVGLLATLWQLARATEAERRAESEAAVAAAVNSFLIDDVLAQASPENEPDRNITLREVVDRAARNLGDRFEEQPLVEAAVRETLAATYQQLGRYKDAEQQIRSAIEIQERYKPLGPEILSARRILISALMGQDRYRESLEESKRVVEERTTLLGPKHVDTIKSKARMLQLRGRLGEIEEAELELQRLLALCRANYDEENDATLSVMANLEVLMNLAGKHDAALAISREVYELYLAKKGKEHPETLVKLTNLAGHTKRDSPVEALKLYREGIRSSTKILGPDHPSTIKARLGLARTLDIFGDREAAEQLFRTILEGVVERDRYLTAECANNLGTLLLDKAEASGSETALNEALKLFRRAEEICLGIYGSDNPHSTRSKINIARVLQLQGKFDEAELLERQVLEICERTIGPVHPTTLSALLNLGAILSQQGKLEEAQEKNAVLVKRARQTEHNLILVQALRNLGAVQYMTGNPEAAIATTQEALEVGRVEPGLQHPDVLLAARNLASGLGDAAGRHQESLALLEEVLPIHKELFGEHDSRTLEVLFWMGKRENALKEDESAADHLRRYVELREALAEEGQPLGYDFACAQVYLAESLRRLDRVAEAEPHFANALNIIEQLSVEPNPFVLDTVRVFAWVLNKQRKYAQARALLDRYVPISQQVLKEDSSIRVELSSLDLLTSRNLCWQLVTAEKAEDRDPARAVELARDCIDLEPKEAEHWSTLGIALTLASDFQEAIEAFERSNQLRGKPAWKNHLIYARALESLGRHEDALQRFCEGWLWFDAFRVNDNDYQQFARETQARLGVDETGRDVILSDYITETQFDQAWQWRTAANWLKDHDQFEQAIEAYTSALKNPNNQDLSWVPQDRGYCYLKLGQYEQAIEDFSSVIEAHPDAAFALRLRAQAYAGLGQTERALEEAYATARIKPNIHANWVTWGEVIRQHYRPNAYAGVEREWQRTREIAPTLPQAWFFTSAWLLLNDRSDDFHEVVRQVVEESDDLNSGKLAWAAIMCAMDPVAITDEDERLARLNLASRAKAEGPIWCRKHAAMIQVRCGQTEQGLALINRIENDADSGVDPGIFSLYLAFAYLNNGDREAAEKAWQKAETLNLEALETLSLQMELEVLTCELEKSLNLNSVL